MNKHYIGDGIFVEYIDYAIILTSEDGIKILDRIVLEAEVLNNLNEYLKRMFYKNQLRNE